MSDLIADCLRAKGVRYFHGHHDWEYFFLLDYLDHLGAGEPSAEFRHGKLHVHLDRGGAPDEITVTVTPDRYYPAVDRQHLMDAAALWSWAETGPPPCIPPPTRTLSASSSRPPAGPPPWPS